CILLTHLDHDHWQGAWGRAMPKGATVRLHSRHAAAARRYSIPMPAAQSFDDGFDLYPGIRVRVGVGAHDQLGVSAFRFEFAGDNGDAAALGFVTDLGHMPGTLIDHLRAVDVLAIESNYCPRLQQS